MRITNVYLKDVGPFKRGRGLFSLNTDDDRVLLTGISGSGKSTALSAIAQLWCMLEGFPGGMIMDSSPSGCMAMHVSGLEDGDCLILMGGDPGFEADIAKRHPGAKVLKAEQGRPMPGWPNMIMLDGDWHRAKKVQDITNAWFLTDDDVSDVWPEVLGNLLKKGDEKAKAALKSINRLLAGKKLEMAPNGGVHVVLDGDQPHGPDRLSMGEKHLAVLCFCAACCLKEGGVLLLDEPAVHLHPSQVMGLLSTLEGYCLNAGGQMLLISHNPAIWQRYEELGLAVELEGSHACE